MLIALELAGFKSFADKTRFDFPDGITVIVGPNGSGKSNVVDAIKWVLGAQSAKALRGKDMIDVIFKGSSGTGRKPSNSAEATLVFDNSKRLLAVDSEEVHVTRRVYRSGEGEYLINSVPCRLKDIKDLFRGTGVGVDAYSLIEQGKVDRMLQASPKDRRVIFEEAAGISRFIAKKAEAQRRLQRVDQNLIRLKDIVDEVHTRLNSLKNQATKAQKYREMTSRLHAIRLRLGWTEYNELHGKTEQATILLSSFAADREAKEAEVVEAKAGAQQAELDLHAVAEQCGNVEARLQDALQRIAVAQNQQSSLRRRVEENEVETGRQSQRLVLLRHRTNQLRTELAEFARQTSDAQVEFNDARAHAEQAEQAFLKQRTETTQKAEQLELLRAQHVQLLRQTSDRAGEVAQQQNLLKDVVQAIAKTEKQLADNSQAEQAARKAAEQSAIRLKQIHEQLHEANSELERVKLELEQNRTELSNQSQQSARLQSKLEGNSQRLEILQDLERQLEGVDAGAQHLIKLKRDKTAPVYDSIYGLVAESLTVEVAHAAMIDTALSNTAHALIVRDGQLIQLARTGQLNVPGRLSLLRMDRIPTRRFGEKVQLEGVAGVIGRADRLIRTKAEITPLFTYLLGTTWLVESLDVALELGHFRGAGLRFITKDCSVLESDGSLTIGSLANISGLVSRRSEIQSVIEEIADCKVRYQKSMGEIERLSGRVDKLKPALEQCEKKVKGLSGEFAHQQATAQTAVSKLDDFELTSAKYSRRLEELSLQRASIEPAIQATNLAVDEARIQIQELDQTIESLGLEIQNSDQTLAKASESSTQAKILFARAEQKLESVRSAYEQSKRNQSERFHSVVEAEEELARLRGRRLELELEILQLTESLANDTITAQIEEVQLEALAAQANELRQIRSAAAKRFDLANRSLEKLTQQEQNAHLDLERLKAAIESLVKRYSEDYQIAFELLENAELVSDADERQRMDQEAATLRQEIATTGEINMAALAELDELQERYDYLNGQYEDLQAAKESLQRIIQKINADSRRLFLETLEIIRTNFQKLYRKSFGGGNADIVLEEGEDVLECGIDIVATPPGKTALSNSLLSGGEKALTAVALLLAIFQYRPSPFCVLDEVDAPFDEANIGRFVNVLNEFLDWTKFIIVTHSKKTMTASTTLYGVTMQESGVSKQVAVRFEDVNEKGEIITESDKAKQRRAA